MSPSINDKLKLSVFVSLLVFFAIFECYAQSSQSCSLTWKTVNGVSIPIPPSVHPRLCFRNEDIADIKNRMSDPALAKIWSTLQTQSQDWLPSQIPTVIDYRYYFQDKGSPLRAQLNGLNYLVSKDTTLGRKAIVLMLDTLEKAQFPAISDVSRPIGLMMFNGATVYDWCYPLLTSTEKQRFINSFLRLAKLLECGYPPVNGSSITGHGSEWMISRDMLSAGIAIYDEFPEMYQLVAARLFGEMIPARNWFYPGSNYHQGVSYLNVRFTNDLIALWLFNKMGAGIVFDPSQQYVLYDILYRRRPDGLVLPAGDYTPYSAKGPNYAMPALFAGSFYKDEYLNKEYLTNPSIEGHCKLLEFLWRDTKLGTKSPTDLPLTHYSGSPFGWMIARTGWDTGRVMAEMKVNEYAFNNHQHLDAGAFQIYYKGPLAIDAGVYEGSTGGYNNLHNKNFFKRTVAHNSLLIYDPNETFPCSNYGGTDITDTAVNDGGQRMPGDHWGSVDNLSQLLNTNFKTGKILATSFGPDSLAPDYSYLKGDITDAYSTKVLEVKRSFVFLNLKDTLVPAVFIVFDKIVSSNPNFKKTWLLHSIEEPQISGNTISIKRTKDGDSGMLVNTTLLPEALNADIQSIGGPGKEFWVAGINYPNVAPGDTRNEAGAWRVEISPKTASKEDYYFNVIQVANNTRTTLYPITKLSNQHVSGVQLLNRIVTFSKNSELIDHSFDVSVTGNGAMKFLVTDLVAGIWEIQKGGQTIISNANVISDKGTLYFEGNAGDYSFILKEPATVVDNHSGEATLSCNYNNLTKKCLVTCTDTLPFNWRLASVDGKIITSGNNIIGSYNIDFERLAKGVYVVSLFNYKHRMCRKIIK